MLLSIPGTPLISLSLATQLLCGITGSASGGRGIAMELLSIEHTHDHDPRCDAIRTPIGRYGRSFSSVPIDDLGAVPIRELIQRNPKINGATGTT